MPKMKILRRPTISATRPIGTRNTAEVRINAVATQLRATASMPKAAPIVGSATLIDEPRNGVRNDAIVATTSAARWTDFGVGGPSMGSAIVRLRPAKSMQGFGPATGFSSRSSAICSGRAVLASVLLKDASVIPCRSFTPTTNSVSFSMKCSFPAGACGRITAA
jgi:hypothetical protein